MLTLNISREIETGISQTNKVKAIADEILVQLLTALSLMCVVMS